jgi:hypothetical protein
MTRSLRLFVLIAATVPLAGCFFDSLFGSSSSQGTGQPGGPGPDGALTNPFYDANGNGHPPDGSQTWDAITTGGGGDAPYVYSDGGVIYMDVWYPLPDGVSPGDDGASGGATASGPLSTGDMSADMSVQSYDGATLTAYATLRYDKFPGDPNPDDIVLTDGDSLTAQVGASGTQIAMTREQGTPGYTARYVATLSESGVTGPFDVIIAFHRTNGMYGAPYSRVTLAAPFAITSSTPATLSHASTLPITISPKIDTSVAGTYVEAFGACISSYYAAQAFDGMGTASFNMSQIQFAGSSPPPSGCDITLRVRGDSNGQVDSAFKRDVFGQISVLPGTQARAVPTHLNP